MENSVTGREAIGSLFSTDVGVLLQQNKKGCLCSSRQPSILEETGKDRISLSGHRFRQVNRSTGDICHQTYCFAATVGEERREKYHKRHHQTN